MSLVAAGTFAGCTTVGIYLWNKIRHPHGQLRKTIQAALEAAGLLEHDRKKNAVPWKIISIKKKAAEWEVILQLPRTKTVLDVQKVKEKIDLAFDCGTDIKQNKFGYIKMVIYRDPLPTSVPYDEDILDMSRCTWRLPIGYDRNGWAYWDLQMIPNLLFAGFPGTGKTVCVTSLIATFILNHPEASVYIYDGKGSGDYGIFESLPQTKIVYDEKEAEKMFKQLHKLLKNRMQTLREKKQRNIDTYNLAYPNEPMERVLVNVDEVAQLPKDVQDELAHILQLGRAAGVHVAVGTQRPDRTVITGQVKALCDAIACFRVQSDTDSEIVLDVAGAESLPKIRGRFIFKEMGEMRILQAPLASEGRLRLMFIKHRIRRVNVDSAWEELSPQEASNLPFRKLSSVEEGEFE